MTETTQSTNTSLVIVGHVDSGKSTTTGSLLLGSNSLDARTLEKYKAQATAQGKGSFYLAWATDSSKAERERGITIESSIKKFTLGAKTFTIIDAPGHKDFIKNMITGTTQADVAILIVPAVQTEFLAGITKGGQTIEHATLVHALGVKKMIICVNKMDRVNYDEAAFRNIAGELWMSMWKIVGKPKMSKEEKELEKKTDVESRRKYAEVCQRAMPIFAISGFEGVGVSTRMLKKEDGSEYDPMPWCKQKTLMEYLEHDLPMPQNDLSLPLHMPVSQLRVIPGVGSVLAGKVMRGVIKKDQAVVVVPAGVKAKVKSIESFHKGVDTAKQGDNIGITLKNKNNDDPIEKGHVVGCAENPPKKCVKFKIKGIVIGDVKKGIKVGYSPILSCHQLKTAVVIKEIHSIASRKAPKVNLVDQRDHLMKGDITEITFETEKRKPISIEPMTKGGVRAVSQVVLRVSNKTMFVGTVVEILE